MHGKFVWSHDTEHKQPSLAGPSWQTAAADEEVPENAIFPIFRFAAPP
jgi:hypothetical protein